MPLTLVAWLSTQVGWQRNLWLLCEEPASSLAARVFAVVSIACIMTSIINFCLETLPTFDRPACLNLTGSADPGDLVPNYNDAFFIVEAICVTWFTFEFILRLVSCPSKFAFCKDIMNIFDVLAILPFFVVLIVQVLIVCVVPGTLPGQNSGWTHIASEPK